LQRVNEQQRKEIGTLEGDVSKLTRRLEDMSRDKRHFEAKSALEEFKRSVAEKEERMASELRQKDRELEMYRSQLSEAGQRLEATAELRKADETIDINLENIRMLNQEIEHLTRIIEKKDQELNEERSERMRIENKVIVNEKHYDLLMKIDEEMRKEVSSKNTLLNEKKHLELQLHELRAQERSNYEKYLSERQHKEECLRELEKYRSYTLKRMEQHEKAPAPPE
jgi:hypothetical protein